MSQQEHSSPSAGIKALTLLVCIILPLIVSSQQAGQFFKQMGTGTDSWVMFATACAIIFSSPILALWVSRSFDADNYGRGIAGAMVCMIIIGFSTLTSTLAIMNTTGSTIIQQVSASPEIKTYQDMLNSNKDSIASKQNQINGRDAVKWASKRDGWARDISSMQTENVHYLSEIKRLRKDNNGSSIGQTFAKLEEYGVTRFGISVLAASLLDLIPFVAGLMLGTGVVRRVQQIVVEQEEVAAPSKKSQPNLRSVM